MCSKIPFGDLSERKKMYHGSPRCPLLDWVVSGVDISRASQFLQTRLGRLLEELQSRPTALAFVIAALEECG